jgi:hypothetical protein
MKSIANVLSIVMILFIMLIATDSTLLAQSTLNCGTCHSDQKALWLSTKHADTQNDVAVELAASWIGQPPDSVISGSQAENCVACHGPIAVTTGSGLSEVQVMGHFFTTTNGTYTASTTVADTVIWPHVACVTCHDVPGDHPTSMPVVSIFNSGTTHYDSLKTTSALCGQCHGSLKFSETDHRIYDAWKASRHGHRNQHDIGDELANNWVGQAPDSLINGSAAENCIACHSPTSVRLPGTGSEVKVLSRFFTTVGGLFTASTTAADTVHWPEMGCDACHNPHNPGMLSYFNSTTKSYQVMNTSNELCGQCHGSLRFPETDHRSYDLETGTGAIGVADKVTMPGAQCVDCHMGKSDIDGSNSRSNKGHSWSPFVAEPDGKTFASCTRCHATMSADSAIGQVVFWQNEFADLDSIAESAITMAEAALVGSSDTTKIAQLAAAKHNLEMVETDESGGFHNHKYSVALLKDAAARADRITGLTVPLTQIPAQFALHQNYPNPFNPSTSIEFQLSKSSMVTLTVYDLRGVRVKVLAIKEKMDAGMHKVTFDGSNLSSGIYLYKLETPEFVQTRKMVLLK